MGAYLSMFGCNARPGACSASAPSADFTIWRSSATSLAFNDSERPRIPARDDDRNSAAIGADRKADDTAIVEVGGRIVTNRQIPQHDLAASCVGSPIGGSHNQSVALVIKSNPSQADRISERR